MLGPIEGGRLMKSATRGWNDAEGTPMVLRRHDHTASSDWLKTLMLED